MRMLLCGLFCAIFLRMPLSATCDRNDLLVTANQPWITDDDFATVIRLSFSNSKCCNVFLRDNKDDSVILFNQFRKIYPHVYLLKRIERECNGYMLLGSSDDDIVVSVNSISTFLWKSEILIILNRDVIDNSTIFNVSLYGHANVNIISTSGVWKLSENYMKPRVFNKLDRYEDMQHDENANLRGRELQVCSIYRPPMTYLNYTVKKIIDGTPAEVFAIDNGANWDGIEVQLFFIIAKKLNFTWTIRKPDGNDTYGMRINDTVWTSGMLQMLHDEKVDLTFAGIWVTLDQSVFVHLTESWHKVSIHFLVPRPRRTTSFWALATPFSQEVWFLLLTILLSHCSYTYIRAWIDPSFPKRFRNFFTTLIDLIGSLLSSSVPKILTTNRLQIILWRTAGWLIITAYCSSLAARLARSEFENRIDTIEQFLEANLSWGSMRREPFGDYFDLTNPSAAQLPSRYHMIENNQQLEQLIAAGNYAMAGQVIDRYFYPNDLVSNDDLKKYRLMRESLSQFFVAFAVQPWLLNHVNRIIHTLRETGIILWHLRDVNRRRNSYSLREVLMEHDGYDGSVQVLGLTPLGAGFSLLLLGWAIATLVFCLELRHTSG